MKSILKSTFAKSLAGLVLIACNGCVSPQPQPRVQTRLYLYIKSDPSYASIYELHTGAYKGQTPLSVVYPIDAEARAKGSVNVSGFRAVWPSGAKAKTTEGLILPVNRFPREITFERPQNDSKQEIDLGYALRKEELEIQRQNTQIQKEQNNIRNKELEEQKEMNDQAAWRHYFQTVDHLNRTLPKIK